MTEYIMSFDVGTSGVKAALVSLEGELAARRGEGVSPGDAAARLGGAGPHGLLAALCACAREVTADLGRNMAVAGISLCTQWKGIIPVDRAGNVLHNSILWLDAGRRRRRGSSTPDWRQRSSPARATGRG